MTASQGGTAPAVVGLPAGFRIVFDQDTRQLDDDTLFGGSPSRVLRLSAPGRRALAELRSGSIQSESAGLLARRLVTAGLAHPRPPALDALPDVTVIVPVRDRPESLARCLESLDARHPVVVVDDASVDAQPIEELCRKHDATLVRLDINVGPGAARNAGLSVVDSEFVAFIDSDCVASVDWIARLVAHCADPEVVAVAPRVVALASSTAVGRYSAACGSLDLGPREALVAPMTRVSYVPTAALIARRSGLAATARSGNVFDPELRVGEDVDLVWRLHQAGGQIRYEPAVEVRHEEPSRFADLFARRFRYGTSAGPLARRHPRSMAPLVLFPWPSVTVAALLARQPVLAVAGAAASLASTRRGLARAKVPATGAVPAAARGISQAWLGLGRYGTQFAAPVLVALALRRRSRIAALSLILGPAIASWRSRRPDLDPVRFTAARIADEVAYGAGVWTGAVAARTTAPVRPKLVSHWSI